MFNECLARHFKFGIPSANVGGNEVDTGGGVCVVLARCREQKNVLGPQLLLRSGPLKCAFARVYLLFCVVPVLNRRSL